MLATVILILLCLLTAVVGVPLILRLIPPNEIYGLRTGKTLYHPEIWYEVNRIAGWALVAAAAITVLAVMVWSGTVLRPVWRQFTLYIVLLGVAVGASFWYERNLDRFRKQRTRRATVRSGAG